jgi:uncharacterized membrane-anchored protein YhcB (DUF1043 family)
MEWLYAVVGVISGLLIGMWVGRISSSAKQLGEELKQTKEELDAYRDKVTQHFSRTAELVEILAANSRDIYRHLASGSQELCNSDTIRLSDTVLKSLPEFAGETASVPRKGEVAEQTVEISAAAEEAQTESAPFGDKGDGSQQSAAAQQGEPGPSAPSESAAENPTDVKQADETAPNSQLSEIMPDVEERKEPARFH